MSKRSFASVLSVVLAAIMLLSACAPAVTPTAAPEPKPAATTAPAATQAPATQAPAPASAAVNPAGKLPIVNEKLTFKVLVRAQPGVKDYNDNAFTKWVEEQTNIKLVVETSPVDSTEAKQKLNLTLAGGDLPDMIIGFNIPLDQQQVLADQGIILPLNDMMDKYGFYFNSVLKDMPDVKEVSTLNNGKLYAMPNINECYHCSASQKMWIYKPWLDKLGLKMPTTTEEFYQVLKAFKEKDPNGNGKADEIPLSGGTGWEGYLNQFLMNPFVYSDRIDYNYRYFYNDKGTLKASFTDKGWQEGVKYLNKLYKEGLLDPEALTNDGDKMVALGENPVPIVGAMPAGWMGIFTQYGAKSNRWKEYVPVAPLAGPSGMRQIPVYSLGKVTDGAFVITKACKNPEAAFRLGDFFFSEEATLRSVFGREGEEWAYVKEGENISGDGKATYDVLKLWESGEQNFSWQQAAPAYRPAKFRMAQLYKESDPLERWLYQWTRDLYVKYGVTDKYVPPLIFTSDQSKQVGELTTAIYNYMDVSYADFITGALDPDKDWDAYIKGMNDNGLEKLLAIYQAAYDAKYKK
jgi:putative aldouronate transport system substrate-binding protein